MRCLLPFIALSLPVPVCADPALPQTTGLQHHVVFTDYSPLSRSAELARRLTSPLTAVQMSKEMSRSGVSLREQSTDLAHEEFIVYVPPAAPPRRYGLLVFVPPWESAIIPQGWVSTLDRTGVIFVSAAKSGNNANVLDRREPLALLAAHNIMARYPVDPDRVYIGGFSGGSRVAMRIALGFPDVFHGVLLNAGSDPIGEREVPLPPVDLLRRFQESTRLVYFTGNRDLVNQDKDAGSMHSMREWCVFDLATEVIPWTGHEVADATALQHALDALLEHVRPDPDKLADCRSRTEKGLTAKFLQVENFVADGKLHEARTLLENIDARYGGLAAPRSMELAEEIDARLSAPGRASLSLWQFAPARLRDFNQGFDTDQPSRMVLEPSGRFFPPCHESVHPLAQEYDILAVLDNFDDETRAAACGAKNSTIRDHGLYRPFTPPSNSWPNSAADRRPFP